jgi:hypothetical protein
MSKISDYTNYFENIATRFVPIGHTPQNPRFATFSREEVLSGMRRNLDLSEWCLVLMNFEIGLRKDGRAFKYEVSGSLEVIKENPRDDISKTSLQDTAEQYVEEIMSQMLKDHDEGTFIGGGKILEDSIELYKLSEAFDQGVGFGLDFKYILPFCRTSAITPTNWLP